MKIVLLLMFFVFTVYASINFQKASKEELMAIKGIGPKKADAIINYRKSHKIKSIEDLKNIKGFGQKLIIKIKKSQKMKNSK